LSGEDDYYLTTALSAADFIENLSAKDFNINKEEYDKQFKEAKEKLSSC